MSRLPTPATLAARLDQPMHTDRIVVGNNSEVKTNMMAKLAAAQHLANREKPTISQVIKGSPLNELDRTPATNKTLDYILQYTLQVEEGSS